MGIKGLNKFLKEFAPGSIKTVELSNFYGKVVAIDTSIYMYRGFYFEKISTSDIGKNVSPVAPFVRQIVRFVKNGIIPLYVFDGKPPKEKANELKGRKNAKESNMKTIDNLNVIKSKFLAGESDFHKKYSTITDVEMDLQKYNKRVLNVKKHNFDQVMELFRLMGIPYIVAVGEAEGLCAKLVKDGTAISTLSEDTDLYPCGCPLVIKDFSPTNNTVTQTDLRVALHELGLTYDQFIDLCILLGSDYHRNTIRGIGPKKAYEYIKKFENIEGIIENTKHTVPDNFNYVKIRELFKHCGEDNLVDESYIPKFSFPVIKKILCYLKDNEIKISKAYIKYLENDYIQTIKKIMENKKSELQLSKEKKISDFFNSKK